MNLLMLAPEIQEEILFLPRFEQGRGEVCLRDLQRVAGEVAWREQRLLRSQLIHVPNASESPHADSGVI